MEERAFIMPETLAVAVLNFLATQPYAEVAPFITAMQQMREVTVSATDSSEESVEEKNENNS